MKKWDFVWCFALCLFVGVLLYPQTNLYYRQINSSHPYFIGFVKFFIFATMGELLSIRIVQASWKKPVGLLARAFVWGMIGMSLVVVFEIFSKGVMAALKGGYLPGSGYDIAFAFFTSLIMNFTFAPTMMAFHRITDTFIVLYYENNKIPSISEVAEKIDWASFLSFVILKTIPFFWVPAHTITFLLPPEYRIVSAAFLSIVLGGILAWAARKKK